MPTTMGLSVVAMRVLPPFGKLAVTVIPARMAKGVSATLPLPTGRWNDSTSSLGLLFLRSRLVRLVRDILGIAAPDVGITCALDARFFAADRVRDPLGLLDWPLAHTHLFALNGLLLDRDLLITHRDAVGLAIPNRLIGRLARTGTTLDIHFLVGDRPIHALLLAHHVFAQACLPCLDGLLLGTQLLLAQSDALLALRLGLPHACASGAGVVGLLRARTSSAG